MRLSILAPLLPALLASATALADNPALPRWYIGLSASLVMLDDLDIKIIAPNSSDTRYKYRYKSSGFGASAALGYRLLPSVRTEMEVTYRVNELDELSLSDARPQRSTAIMGNLYVDFRNGSRFTPYIGAGIGGVRTNVPIYFTLFDGMGTPVETLTLKEWMLGYQGMAGLTYTLDPGKSRKELYAGYRYMGTHNARISAKSRPDLKLYFPNDSHNFEIGGRVYF